MLLSFERRFEKNTSHDDEEAQKGFTRECEPFLTMQMR
ncbi:hypothetical protein DU19_0123 [Chlamydia muridarum]|uniref:Uncharacterized protein n=1 Tax=Chlamydia muridarum (strain MoPn / Nigg) TaxID=243161 RepID=Q9PLI6_CHLMU|nr:hypothetical protein TC_0113 [Chlamydia muridarum str. Nigg]KDU80214.1 hypothetical protein DU17_0143 [Chlamydia muridarum]KDU80868.1 hypothetical protein DU17_0123 [Chlamydia muridarum]KDU81108.1 hypothetical protein DU18_0124 [Chlamydia muridarum]KDU81122.1 hypothetical protein DU18_0144 [Chlamydia muridarum]